MAKVKCCEECVDFLTCKRIININNPIPCDNFKLNEIWEDDDIDFDDDGAYDDFDDEE